MRTQSDLRHISFQAGLQVHAAGSCLVSFGGTQVLCAASLETWVPPHVKGTGRGWLTAEYGMLPGSTNTRASREARKGRQDGRTVEIQRLIGRSLRQAVDLGALGERQITLDCDVLNADGGTRCAAITGGWVALVLALRKANLDAALVRQVAAVSVGLLPPALEGGRGGAVLDLDYEEDHRSDVDANVVASRRLEAPLLELVEFQAAGEGRSYGREEAVELMDLGLAGCQRIMALQQAALH